MTMIKNINKYLIATICAVASFSSCSFLDVVPPQSMDVDDAIRDKDRAIAYLYSGYEYCTEIYKQHLVRNYVSSVDEYALPDSWGVNSQRTAWGLPNSGEVWDRNFDHACTYIGRVNHFLYLLDQTTPQHATADDIKRWRAECNFLLGFYHMHMLFAIGPCPIMDHWYADASISKYDFPGRSHFNVCVERICQWFDLAAADLPETVDLTELGRATKSAAKALKARTLLYAASDFWNGECPEIFKNWTNTDGSRLMNSEPYWTWEQARIACEEALAESKKAGRDLFRLDAAKITRNNQDLDLPVIPGYGDSEEDLLFREYVSLMQYVVTTSETDGNRETVWGIGDEIKNRFNGSIGYLEWTNTATPQAITKFNGTIIGGRNGVSPFLNTVENFYTKNGKLPKNDTDFAPEAEWHDLTDHVVTYKETIENEDGTTTTNETTRQPITKLNCNREPRFYAWISFDGAEYGKQISSGKPLFIDMCDDDKQGYNSTSTYQDINVTGYLCRKFIQPNYIVSSEMSMDDNLKQQSVRAIPFAVVRVAELYLNLAECYAMEGKTGEALTNLNMVRERAGIPALTTADVGGDMSLMDWVKAERFIELWGEGHRYFDLRRWCMAPDYLKAGARRGLNYGPGNQIETPSNTETYLNIPVEVDQPFVWENRMYLQPIVYNEVDSNPQLVQAPEY